MKNQSFKNLNFKKVVISKIGQSKIIGGKILNVSKTTENSTFCTYCDFGDC